jgi:hypothetical protein
MMRRHVPGIRKPVGHGSRVHPRPQLSMVIVDNSMIAISEMYGIQLIA